MKRIEKVGEALARLCAGVTPEEVLEGFNGFPTEEVCRLCGVIRTNASKELNLLVEQRRAVKVNGRPVRYFDAAALCRLLGVAELPPGPYAALADAARPSRPRLEEAPEPPPSGRVEEFATILATRPSCANVVKQCKAAIIYPPGGLHTLLVGPSGVGKTFFAEAMFNYAKGLGLLAPEGKFVIFNCAEYADNPQLILSQLFGYAKGAFTGADRETPGIVDQADGGILLLDEVHRLPPQGQEMLFTLIDKGFFRRLGETGGTVQVNLRLICATTEDVESSMLTTFLRRIPMVITLPSLQDLPLEERYNLIRRNFDNEVDALGIPVSISREAILGLLLYCPKGNLGQLRGDIQRICARGYLEHTLQNRRDGVIEIDANLIPEEVYQGILKLKDHREEVEKIAALGHQRSVTFRGGSAIPRASDSIDTAKLYGQIQQLYEKYTSRNMEKGTIGESIKRFIEDYMDSLMDNSSLAASEEENEKLYKMVTKRVYDAAAEALGEAERLLGHRFSRKVAVAFALHVSVLLERLATRYAVDITPEEVRRIVEEHPAEYGAAKGMREMIQSRLGVSIPEEEIAFFSVFLYSLGDQEMEAGEGCVGVVILAHGRSTASSMAEVANTLLKTEHCLAVDMDLGETVEHCLERTCQKVREADQGKGVLLLVDMGSLTAFGEIIAKRTGIPVRCVEMVSTPIALEAVRKSIFREENLDALAQNLLKNIPYTGKLISQEVRERGGAGAPARGGLVVTTCASGLGAAVRLAGLIQKNVPAVGRLGIEVKAVDHAGARLAPEEAARALAVVGAVDLKLPGVPFIPVDEVIMGRGFQRLEELLRGGGEGAGERPTPNFVVSNMLGQYLTFLDPVKANEAVDRSFQRLSQGREWRDEARARLCYLLHNCCLVERVILGQTLSYDGLTERVAQDREGFRQVREALEIIETAFSIKIPDTEAAYVLDLIDTD